jgi:hypothetical protein
MDGWVGGWVGGWMKKIKIKTSIDCFINNEKKVLFYTV